MTTLRDEKKFVYLLCVEEDARHIRDLYRSLKRNRLRVETPLFHGSPEELRAYEEQVLKKCDGVLLYYGAGTEAWKYSKECLIRRVAGLERGGMLPSYCVYVTGTRDEHKARLIQANKPYVVDSEASLFPSPYPFFPWTDGVPEQQIPYPGLRPYLARMNVPGEPGVEAIGEEHFFFGRDRQVNELLEKMKDSRFTAVVGVSGSGKSSLVTCGLVPTLHGGYLEGAGPRWHVVYTRPKEDPIRSLATDLHQMFGHTTGFSLERIHNDLLKEVDDFDHQNLPLIQLYKAWRTAVIEASGNTQHPTGAADTEDRRRGFGNLLIIVDQFEELFPKNESERYADDERMPGSNPARTRKWMKRQYVRLLLGVLRQLGEPVYVCITMRSDFVGEAAMYSGLPEMSSVQRKKLHTYANYVELPEAINKGLYLVPRLNLLEVQAVIHGPGRVVGSDVEDALMQQLMHEWNDDPAQLPVLQHALNRAWHQRGNVSLQVPISLNDYHSVGGMERALDAHATDVLGTLVAGDKRYHELTKRIFTSLTGFTDDGRGIRLRVAMSVLHELVNLGPGHYSRQEVEAVLDAFEHDALLIQEEGLRWDNEDKNRQRPDEQAGQLVPDVYTEVSHESLMNGWGLLQSWMIEEGRDGQLYKDLASSALEEKRTYWVGNRLQRALQLRKRTGLAFVWAERYIPVLTFQLTGLDTDKPSRAKRRTYHAETERFLATSQSRRRWRWGIGIFIGLLLVSAFLGITRERVMRQAEVLQKTESWLRSSALVSSYNALTRYSLDQETEAMELARTGYLLSDKSEGMLQDNVHDVLRSVYTRSMYDSSYMHLLTLDPITIRNEKAIRTVAYSTDGRKVSLGDEAGRLYILEAESNTYESLFGEMVIDGSVRDIAWDGAGEKVVAVGQVCTALNSDACTNEQALGRIVTLEAVDGSRPYRLNTLPVDSALFTVSLSQDGRFLVTAGKSNRIDVWEWGQTGWEPSVSHVIPRWTALSDLMGSGARELNWVNEVRFFQFPSLNEPVLAAASQDGRVRIWSDWNDTSQTPLELMPDVSDSTVLAPINGIAFSAPIARDRLLMATGGEDFSVRLWGLVHDDGTIRLDSTLSPSGYTHISLPGTDAVINTVDFSPIANDTTFFVAAGDGGKSHAVLLWDLRRLRADWLEQGRASGGSTLWQRLFFGGIKIDEDPISRPLIFRGHSKWVHSLAFHPEGNQFMSGGEDGRVKIWSSDPGKLATNLCNVIREMEYMDEDTFRNMVSRNLSWEEYKDILACSNETTTVGP